MVAFHGKNKPEFITFWGGQSAPILKHRKAADLMNELISETGKHFH
jgi:nitronate monooxygenase